MEEHFLDLKHGNKDSLEFIYEKTNKLVFSICLSYMKDRMLAEDMMQEIYLKVYLNINKYRNGSNPVAWICKISKNTCINELIKRKRQILIDYDEADIQAKDDSNETPLLDIAYKVLKEKELSIVILHVVNQIKLVEISKMYKISSGTTRWIYSNALNKIKKYLERSSENV